MSALGARGPMAAATGAGVDVPGCGDGGDAWSRRLVISRRIKFTLNLHPAKLRDVLGGVREHLASKLLR